MQEKNNINKNYKSTYYYMVKNPNHKRYETGVGGIPLWHLIDDTLYQYFYVWERSGRRWLDNFSNIFWRSEYKLYRPVATIKGDTLIGYNFDRSNTSNWLLQNELIRDRYKNLYWCDIDSHPYPREVRMKEGWLEEKYRYECHILRTPNVDPSKWFIPSSTLYP